MSLAKSNYLEGKVIEHVLRNVSYTSPTTVYLALYTSNPAEDNSGTEAAGGSYARQAITFGAHSGGQVDNTGDIEFTGMPSGTFTHVGILDAVTSGNLLYFGALDDSLALTAGSTAIIPDGDLVVAET